LIFSKNINEGMATPNACNQFLQHWTATPRSSQ
jgi:hypothetical protein